MPWYVSGMVLFAPRISLEIAAYHLHPLTNPHCPPQFPSYSLSIFNSYFVQWPRERVIGGYQLSGVSRQDHWAVWFDHFTLEQRRTLQWDMVSERRSVPRSPADAATPSPCTSIKTLMGSEYCPGQIISHPTPPAQRVNFAWMISCWISESE